MGSTIGLISYPDLRDYNRPFAASHSRDTKSKSRTGQDKQKTSIILNCNFLCLSCPSATFAHQHGGFVSREWLAAKGLLATEKTIMG